MSKYIVLQEIDGIFYCINNGYSSSYIQCIEINKDDIESVDGVVSNDEMIYIRKLFRQTDTKNVVKKKIKEIVY